MTSDTQPVVADVVSRSEFEQHRMQVSRDIEGLSDAIRESVRATDRGLQQIREDIKDISATTGRPQWQALGFAFGVFSFVIIAIAGVWTWGESRVQNALESRLGAAEASNEHFHGMVIQHQKEGHPQLANLIDVQLSEIARRMDKAERWEEAHDLRVRGLNSAQWERIKFLERTVYGKPAPVVSGEAPGAGPPE